MVLNIVVPMAGKGSRFQQAGYTFPKPLIEVKGKPMIQIVVENLRPKCAHRFIFIVQKEHYQKYAMHSLLNLIAPGCKIVQTEGVTAGAACTVLLAKEYIDNDDDMVIANSDQFVDFELDSLVDFARKEHLDGAILTFDSTHPKWSFARVDETGYVVEVAEKNPISNHATVGIYYYGKGNFFVKHAQEMISKGIRVNNEFYVCPVYNEMILDNLKIKIFNIPVSKMHGLGTPEDLNEFLKSDAVNKI
ncbi:Bifunctional protein GlmU [uncultured archaeon]|nr:Bifunctional protein GlmU [uncultured archaeon]